MVLSNPGTLNEESSGLFQYLATSARDGCA
jgi:hypothetical protein